MNNIRLGDIWDGPTTSLDLCTDLAELASVVQNCQNCRLRAGCSSVVFGEGVPTARLMLIGEGPGADEDKAGRPFVGKAGQLLDRILECAGFERRTNCYIANVVKCRPPGNRTPEPSEREACWANLRAQIRLVRPAIIVLLGATALQTVVAPSARITQARGQWVEKQGIHLMPTFHPAALLRNPDLKKPCWLDFKAVVRKYRDIVDPNHTAPYV